MPLGAIDVGTHQVSGGSKPAPVLAPPTGVQLPTGVPYSQP